MNITFKLNHVDVQLLINNKLATQNVFTDKNALFRVYTDSTAGSLV